MRVSHIIAICGFKRTGKDTIANYIAQHYGYEHMKLADPLKSVCKTLFGFTDEQVEGHEKEKTDPMWGVQPRQVMQFMGTEIMQFEIERLIPGLQRQFWAKNLICRLAKCRKPVVISDIRFKHEIQALRELNVPLHIIKVHNNRVDIHVDSHVSEKEWCEIREDVNIYNHGTLSDLYAEINKVMLSLMPNGFLP